MSGSMLRHKMLLDFQYYILLICNISTDISASTSSLSLLVLLFARALPRVLPAAGGLVD